MKRSTLLIALLPLTLAACNPDEIIYINGGPHGDAGGDGPGSSGDDGSMMGDDGGTQDDGSTGDMDSSTEPDTSTGSVDNSDGFGASRLACINEINKLRATESHAAYTLWDTAAVDMCVDQQATYDQGKNSPHDAWISGVYPTCNGNAQDECLGYGTSPAAVVACLDSMWNERLQSNCASCASCNGPKLTSAVIACESTTTCDFYGKYGGECGHYLNMSADYFSYAACGFSTAGGGAWAVQNFK